MQRAGKSSTEFSDPRVKPHIDVEPGSMGFHRRKSPSKSSLGDKSAGKATKETVDPRAIEIDLQPGLAGIGMRRAKSPRSKPSQQTKHEVRAALLAFKCVPPSVERRQVSRMPVVGMNRTKSDHLIGLPMHGRDADIALTTHRRHYSPDTFPRGENVSSHESRRQLESVSIDHQLRKIFPVPADVFERDGTTENSVGSWLRTLRVTEGMPQESESASTLNPRVALRSPRNMLRRLPAMIASLDPTSQALPPSPTTSMRKAKKLTTCSWKCVIAESQVGVTSSD